MPVCNRSVLSETGMNRMSFSASEATSMIQRRLKEESDEGENSPSCFSDSDDSEGSVIGGTEECGMNVGHPL